MTHMGKTILQISCKLGVKVEHISYVSVQEILLKSISFIKLYDAMRLCFVYMKDCCEHYRLFLLSHFYSLCNLVMEFCFIFCSRYRTERMFLLMTNNVHGKYQLQL